MTYPPQGQYPPPQGQPPQGPYGPPQPYQYQQGQYPQQPGGYPGYPGFPGGQPPRRNRTGLIVGVVIGVLVIVGGGITAAVLLSGGDSKTSASPAPSTQPSRPSATASSKSASSRSSTAAASGGIGKSTPDALEQAIIDAYNNRDSDAFQPLSCTPISDSEMQQIRTTMDQIPAQVTYSEVSPPQVTGSSGTLTLQASASGTSKSFQLPISSTSGNWCMSG
ncbi:hypothetical protein FHX82_001206 [Amycolatopsis bartoniae]|uniref:DUF4878 domain-containing protein n=1 Tax=Amycolatopsis bartoniae TaxID=941986 RepID=A0A8H9J7K8_9PSEU|nr:hypothetical protein [Amycolatopsis bartoniae]MBB2934186.1 hypothetical protein [Amycolatopsis bartoniae]TVT08701.1 hypothetical protein FNH07_11260 [Amycolatopsis bartoniae]GHF88606.1 hypothetical protein GCM10017566_72920 [Amycolatopsis bartoniae]